MHLPRHHSWISPCDFDISPYFSVIKPAARRAHPPEGVPGAKSIAFSGDVAASAV
jgi:hypothetical protein